VKKGLLALLIAVLALGSLFAVGCAPEATQPSGGDSGTTTPAQEEEEQAPSQPAGEVIHWQFQGHPPVSDYYFTAVQGIADHITAMSGGRLVVEAYAGGSIVPASEELEGVHQGILNMGSACPMYAINKVPQAALFDMVSGGMTAMQMTLWHTHGNGDELAARMWEDKFNVKYISPQGFLPPEVWCQSTKKIATTKDLDGLKMRCSGDGGEILASMGVSTVFFPGAEIYESMQRGVIDAFEYASPFLNWGMGFHEVADYLYQSPSRAPTDCAHVWVNRDDWESLSPDLQAIIYDAVAAVGLDYTADSYMRDDEALVKYYEYGTEVTCLPTDVESAYLQAAQNFYDKKAASDPFYAEILEAHWAFKDLCDRAGIK
jgi:TRAP-type mannitol/chloroaromatic compound transport system substrate-binding protein